MSHSHDLERLSKDAGGIEVEKVSTLDVGNVPKDTTTALTEEEKKILKRATLKTDWRLIPILGACYAISGIDRINISAARIAGMNRELGFNIGDRYSIALLVFFITYFIFEIPSNVVLRKVGAANWLAFLCMSWGLVTFGAGFAKKWTDIVVCRLLLGLFEAGFFPGCVYLISCWYTRFEVQKRLAAFYCINIVAVGFGSILAYGCMQLSGRNGWLGWRWIFIINGAMTMFLAVLGRLLIVDFPDKVYRARYPFLKPEEVKSIQDKLERDRRDAEFDELTGPKFIQALKKWELWVFAMKFFAVTTIVYALAFFIPIILQGMGYTTQRVFLLSAPPAIAAVPWVMLCSWAADRYKIRAPFVILQALIGIVGLMIVAYSKNNRARYFGIFMGLAGANANIPTCLAWQANNIRGQSLRMVASGLQVGFGAVGGIYASTVFMEREIPTYRTGIWAVTGAQLYLIVSSCAMVFYYWRQNKKADRGEIIIEGLEGFRYTY
ncbi:major facilitator superfamily domain-containing protein [Paraphoma chrysanthemicola]|uniref:Major facilitator superfamily domain-containing protein n=1 Tax=Paraphoma chrysanthemicola TaxID=798071 RepID=A0A8K0R987_9PLEO|nr:major facilitator superfamily domain-containing protein [Paraphoma chrysanthemicola]